MVSTVMNVEELKTLGNKAFTSGEFNKAVEHFSSAIEQDKNNAVLFSNRSAAYCSLKNYEQALQDAQSAIGINPSWAKAYGRMGAALVGMNKLTEAKEAYQKGLEIEPGNAQLSKGLKEVESKGSSSSLPFNMNDPRVLQKLLSNPKVAEYFKDPSFLQKISMIQTNPQVALEDPRIIEVFGVLFGGDQGGKCEDEGCQDEHCNTQETEQVKTEEIKTEEIVEEVKPEPSARDLANEQKDLGNAEYKQKHFESAIQFYKKALEIDDTHVAVMNNIAAVYFEQQEFERCIQQCVETVEKAREIRADFELVAKAYARMGSAQVKLGLLDESIVSFQKSLTEHRTRDVLDKLRETEKKRDILKQKAYQDPAKAEEERNKGNELFKNGKFSEALSHYNEAIKRDPNDPRGYSNRAACYSKLAAFPEAYKDCEKCLSVDPTFVKAYLRMASIDFMKKDFSKCLERCDEAKKCDTEGKHLQEIEAQMYKCYTEMNQSQNREEMLANATKDPEIQAIVTDPVMQSILQQMQQDPKAFQDHMKNPDVARKIQKLINCGIIKLGK